MTQRRIPWAAVLVLLATGGTAAEPDRPPFAIGCTVHATALPGGRHVNVATSRATLLLPGRGPLPLAADLADEPGSWTQFAGWFPDGATAIVGRGWERGDNGRWEEEHGTFRFQAGDWLYDTHLVDLHSGRAVNVTAVDRVSFYNTGVFAWPGTPDRLGFTALVDGVSKPFAMDLDGSRKVDLAAESRGFAYGFSASPDGDRVSYHENYQLWLADADGGNRVHVDTGHPFVFAPAWSPDGSWLLFLAGEREDCHPHVVRADGTGLRLLARRGGYRGWTEFLDVPDFHQGSSDVPAWSADGRTVFFTARVSGSDAADETVELFAVDLDPESKPRQLTVSPPGTTHYHPRSSPDGGWLLYGSRRDGGRNLFARRLHDGREVRLTSLPRGWAAMHGHWQPISVPPGAAVAEPLRRRRLLYNVDGDSCLWTKPGAAGPAEVTAADLQRVVDEVTFETSRVDTFAACVNAQVTYYPSAVGTLRGTLSSPEERERWPASERRRFANVAALLEAGVDPTATLVARARERGREAWISFRMNDDHGDDFLQTAFRRDHPDWVIGGERYAGRDALDFRRDEVREHVVALVAEAVDRFDCDGVELDFNRFPRFFRDDVPEPERVRLLDDLVRRIRGALDATGRRRGRRLVLAVRVPSNLGRTPPTPATARAVGCDAVAWAAAGLVDHVTVSEFLLERGDLPVGAWRAVLPQVSLAFGIECTRDVGGASLTAEEYRQAARRLVTQGAEGVYLFNFFTSRERADDPVEPPFDVLRDLGPP